MENVQSNDKVTVFFCGRERLLEVFRRAERQEFRIAWMQRGESKRCLWILSVEYPREKQAQFL